MLKCIIVALKVHAEHSLNINPQ